MAHFEIENDKSRCLDLVSQILTDTNAQLKDDNSCTIALYKSQKQALIKMI